MPHMRKRATARRSAYKSAMRVIACRKMRAARVRRADYARYARELSAMPRREARGGYAYERCAAMLLHLIIFFFATMTLICAHL